MGASPLNQNFAEQTAYHYTSTRSIFTFDVGGMVQMTVTFLSPVTPDDLLRSSLPYAYVDVTVESMDGDSHDVQLYTDISAGTRVAYYTTDVEMLTSRQNGPPEIATSLLNGAMEQWTAIRRQRTLRQCHHQSILQRLCQPLMPRRLLTV